MKTATVRMGDLHRSGRWDPKYHLPRVQHQEVIKKLMTLPDDKFERLLSLAPVHQDALRTVIRTNAWCAPRLEYLANHSREEKAVYLAQVLNNIQVLENEAADLELRAAEMRSRKLEIEAILKVEP